MEHKLRAAFSLPFMEWAVFLEAWVLLLGVDLGLRWLPFTRLQGLVVSGGQRASNNNAGSEIHRLDRLVDIAARNHIYSMTCLRRALALQWLLARRGIVATLQIGVRKQAGQLNAHAWIEYAGQAFGQTIDAEAPFTPLVALEA